MKILSTIARRFPRGKMWAICLVLALAGVSLASWLLLSTVGLAKERRYSYRGRPLAQWLRNDKVGGATEVPLDRLLTLEQRITGEEPEIATFSVPIRYDAVTNIGCLSLVVDGGRSGSFQECLCASNGNCLLVWNTTYDSPGKHYVQARLWVRMVPQASRGFEVNGPISPYYSSNVCQFEPFYSEYDLGGAILYAKLAQSNANYSIELTGPGGTHIKTITGSTSNGVIKEHWNLADDRGMKYTNGSFDSTFSVTFPDSRAGTNRQSYR